MQFFHSTSNAGDDSGLSGGADANNVFAAHGGIQTRWVMMAYSCRTGTDFGLG